MIKNSSEYLDVKELVDFVLEYGKDNSLPNMEGSGEAAYQAALRLQQHGLPKAYDGVTIEESLHTVHRREDLYDDDYGDCTRLHCGAFVVDLYYRSGNRELAESSIGVFNAETVLDDEGLQYEKVSD